jgi:hypothetical protein
MSTSTINNIMTTKQVADRFNVLAQQEKWFEIQDEFFSDNVKSTEPPGSPYLENAEGKKSVRAKAENFIKTIQAFHSASTSAPLVCGNHFAVTREIEITVERHGRIRMEQIMLYEVKNGMIVSEQFFY